VIDVEHYHALLIADVLQLISDKNCGLMLGETCDRPLTDLAGHLYSLHSESK
jgi:hypothetical protein